MNRWKHGDHEVPANNRPLSLLTVASKVSERIALQQFNPLATGDLAEKHVLKLVEGFFWSLSRFLRAKSAYKPADRLRCLFSQVQNKRLQSSGMRRKQNFDFWV